MMLLGERFLPVAAAIVFLVLCIPSAASQSQSSSSFDVEDMETFFGDRNITFSTSYTNHNLSYGQVLVPDELRSSLVDVRTPGKPRSSVDGVNVFQPPGQQGKSLELAYQFSDDVSVDELQGWTYGSEKGGSGMLDGKTVNLDLDNDSKEDVFSADLSDNGVSWDITVRSHYEHLIVDYRLIKDGSGQGNESGNSTRNVLWTGQDVYQGEETSVVPLSCTNTKAFTEDGKKKQSVTLCPDNQYDDPHKVTVLTAYPEDYTHSNFTAEDLDPVPVKDAKKWYSDAEKQVLENNLSNDLLIPENNLTDYRFKAYNLTLPEDSTPRLTSELVTGQEELVEGLKMYIIGSIGGTTTYQGSEPSQATDSVEDGDISEYYNGAGAFQTSDVRSYSGGWSILSPTTSDDNGDNPTLERDFSLGAPSEMQTAMYSTDETVRTRWFYQGTRIIRIEQSWWTDEIMVNDVKVGDPPLDKWFLIELKKIDWSSDTIGEVYVNGNLEATDVAFEASAPGVDEVNLAHNGGSVGDEGGYFDVVTVGDGNKPPIYNEINSYPINWSVSTPIDWNVSVTDPDNNLEGVWAKVEKDDEPVKGWTKANNLSKDSYYGIDDFYTPSSGGNFSLLIRANDTAGGYNRSNTTQNIQRANLNLLLEDPPNDVTLSTPLSHDFSINCFSVGGCSKASLFLNYTGNKSYTSNTYSSSDWNQGSFSQTQVDEDNLTLAGSTDVIGETGSLTLSSTIDDGSVSKTVNLANSYSNPVVAAYIPTRSGGQTIDVRVRNVQSSSFEVFMEEPDNEGHAEETVSWMVMEKGSHQFVDGTKVEAGTLSTSSVHREGDSFGGVSVSFDQSFSSSPVVVHSLNTYNNGAFMSSLSTNIGSNSFELEQEALGSGSSASTETIGWIAFQNIGGTSTVDGNKYYVKYQPTDGDNDGVEDTSESLSYSFSNAPDVMVDTQTATGADGHTARGAGTYSSSQHSFYAEEDEVGDLERGHADTGFGMVAFQPGSTLKTGSYQTSGTYTSKIFSHPDPVSWKTVEKELTTPSNTDLDIDYAENSSGSWTYYDDMPSDVVSQFFRFNVSMSSSDSTVTPQLASLNLSYENEEEVFRDVKTVSDVQNDSVNTISYNYSSITRLASKSVKTLIYEDMIPETFENGFSEFTGDTSSYGTKSVSGMPGSNSLYGQVSGSTNVEITRDLETMTPKMVEAWVQMNGNNGQYDDARIEWVNGSGDNLLDINLGGVNGWNSHSNPHIGIQCQSVVFRSSVSPGSGPYHVEYKELDWQSYEIGEVYVNGVLEDENVPMCTDSRKITGVDAYTFGTGDYQGWYDNVTVGRENVPPKIEEVSTSPESWIRNQPVDLSINASDRNSGSVSKVTATWFNGSASSKTLTSGDNGVYTFTDFLTPVEDKTYKIGVNVTDNNGAWNYTNRTYEFRDLSLPQTFEWNILGIQSDGQQAFADSSRKVTVVQDDPDSSPPNWFNFKDNSKGSITQLEALNISVEWRDNDTGVEKAILATNESGSWENVSAAPCRQEFANQTDDNTGQTDSDQDPPTDGNCQINTSGEYNASTGWVDGGYEETVDGNWSTSAQSDEDNGYSNVTLNYTKPSTALSATWEVKDSEGRENVSIPDSCFNYYEDKLRLFFESSYQTFSGLTGYDIQYYCYNGGWNKIEDQSSGGLNGAQIYEEAIHWNTLENVSDGKVRSDFAWKNKSFNGTLAFKIYGSDAAGNWNKTSVKTVAVNQILSENIVDTIKLSDSTGSYGDFFGDSNTSLSISQALESQASASSLLNEAVDVNASVSDAVTGLEQITTPVTISLELSTQGSTEDNQSTGIDVDGSTESQATGEDKASATFNVDSDVEVLGVSASDFLESTIGLDLSTKAQAEVTDNKFTAFSLVDDLTHRISEETRLSSNLELSASSEDRVTGIGTSSANITISEDLTTYAVKFGEIFTPFTVTSQTEGQGTTSGTASATIRLSSSTTGQGLVTEALQTAFSIEEICWAGAPCYQDITENQTQQDSGGSTGVIGGDGPTTIIKPIPIERTLPESLQLYYQKYRNQIQGFLLFLIAATGYWTLRKIW